jgi:anaerobic selenocysteine-containing dehydrogenase
MVGSDWLIIISYFLTAYGTRTIGDHTSICNAAGPVANQLIRGRTYGTWDFENAAIILNFGSSVLEAHTNHLPMAQRYMEAMSRGTKMYTFDVRLSNTAAKSTEWIPVKPATDLAVVLAMCRFLIEEGLHDEDFIRTYTDVSVKELEEHLASYTPEWAEGVSGVPAEKIRSIAREYGRSKPGLCISFRGAFMHYNGVETQRAIQMLEAIAGNVDATGGSGGVGPRWNYPFAFPRPKVAPKRLDILDGEKGAYAYPLAHVSHQVFSQIDQGPERPEIYMTYCHNPVYSNGDCGENARILQDEEKVPFLVSVDVALSETTELADLVLPDATYLERWTCEAKTSPEHIPEYYIRQPMHSPLGEARNFCDVVCDLAKRLGMELGFGSAEEFVRATCDATPGVKEVGGFEFMRRNGVWCDTEAKPSFFRYREEVDVSGVTLDPATGVYYRKGSGDGDYTSLDAVQAAMRYVAQKCGDSKARRGFPPGYGVKKSGLFEIKSNALAEKGFPAIPAWTADPTHQRMADGELILTTFKVSTQSHSRTQNCKWLTELYHENPAWIHPKTAAQRGIENGDRVIIESEIGKIETRAHVTEAVHPGAVAISNHCGHWAYGVYASGKPSHDHICEPDCRLMWWEGNGVHPNHIIPNRGDPIAGSMCWNDTVVRVRKA